MRSPWDRVRHAISFELIGLVLITPLGAWAIDKPLEHIGLVALVSATVATLWTYVYNLVFDSALLRLNGSARKSVATRLVHAVLFEAGLLTLLLPFIAWSLEISLIRAFLLDLSFAGFYLVYAFAFNWAYDVAFPVAANATPGRTG